MIRRFEVADHSMSPALEPGDYLVARSGSRFRRGDVVVFEHPDRTGFWMVKRLVGLPGESVAIRDGRLLVDGTSLDDPWGKGITAPEGEWSVGSHEGFVLSDARDSTRADSRTLGPIPVAGLYPVAFRYWPFGRIRRRLGFRFPPR